jgi:AcrR family transcriptional regulator
VSELGQNLRERIVRAAAGLLAEGGREAVSTRAVSAAAGVQAPAIYRQFGDMQELVHAAAREILARYVRHKATHEPSDDPLEDLRRGWDEHVEFGLGNPAAYALLYGDPESGTGEQESREGLAILERRVQRLAQAGLLRVSVPHAVRVIHAGGNGVTMALIGTPREERDARLSHAVRDALYASLLVVKADKTAQRADRVAAHAVALRAVLDDAPDVLTRGEKQLLAEWLDRLATAEAQAPAKRGNPRGKPPTLSKRR